MTQIDVALFHYSDATMEKFWHHGIRTEQTDAVLENFWIITRNRKGREPRCTCSSAVTIKVIALPYLSHPLTIRWFGVLSPPGIANQARPRD